MPKIQYKNHAHVLDAIEKMFGIKSDQELATILELNITGVSHVRNGRRAIGPAFREAAHLKLGIPTKELVEMCNAPPPEEGEKK